MHKGGNELNLNLNVSLLFLQETYTSTDNSLASMQVSSHVYHSVPGFGGAGFYVDQVNKMTGYESKSLLWIWELGRYAIRSTTLVLSRLDCQQFSTDL